MEPKAKTGRANNFTMQECVLLAEILGEDYNDMGMSRHQVDKQRFSSVITNQTKKKVWQDVELKYNASAENPRTASELQKKWDNLTSKQRAIYSDYQRAMTLTGRGPIVTKYNILTEAVMEVIGKESLMVKGVGGVLMDTTYAKLQRASTSKTVMPAPSTVDNDDHGSLSATAEADELWHPQEPFLHPREPIRKRAKTTPTPTPKMDKVSSSKTCSCERALTALKKRKLQLEIQLLKLQIRKSSEE